MLSKNPPASTIQSANSIDPFFQKNDLDLIHLIRQDNKTAFRKLYLKYYEPLCQFTWRIVSNKDAAKDIVQDVFLKIWLQRKTLEINSSAVGYIYRAVRNRGFNYLQKMRQVQLSGSKVLHVHYESYYNSDSKN